MMIPNARDIVVASMDGFLERLAGLLEAGQKHGYVRWYVNGRPSPSDEGLLASQGYGCSWYPRLGITVVSVLETDGV